MCVRCVYDECTRFFGRKCMFLGDEMVDVRRTSAFGVFCYECIYTCITTFPLSVLILKSHRNVNAV